LTTDADGLRHRETGPSIELEVLSACRSGTGNSTAAEGRIERCADRLLRAATAQDASDEDARRYVREGYCARFEGRGWVYEDGALSIAAHIWLEDSATCAAGTEGEPTKTVPCEEERRSGRRTLECALLRHVRRSEVRKYVERLRREGGVECDDRTPLDDLGVR
jgi:hypothetical protein